MGANSAAQITLLVNLSWVHNFLDISYLNFAIYHGKRDCSYGQRLKLNSKNDGICTFRVRVTDRYGVRSLSWCVGSLCWLNRNKTFSSHRKTNLTFLATYISPWSFETSCRRLRAKSGLKSLAIFKPVALAVYKMHLPICWDHFTPGDCHIKQVSVQGAQN